MARPSAQSAVALSWQFRTNSAGDFGALRHMTVDRLRSSSANSDALEVWGTMPGHPALQPSQPTSATEPEVVATTNAPPTPVVTPDAGTLLDAANLALQISVAVVALVTLLIALTAFFGLREVTELRRRSQELKDELRESSTARAELEKRLGSLQEDLESLVLVAHLFNEGQVAYRRGDYDRAIHFYSDVLHVQPGNSKVQVRLARCYINKGMNGRAERLLRMATSADPGNGDAWRALSTSRRYVDLVEAVSHAERAVELDEGSMDNWNYLGLLQRDQGRHMEAAASHDEAIRLAPLDPLGYFYKAALLIRLNRTDDADSLLREAYAKVEAMRRTGRIKEIWASTIEWAYRRHLDSPEQEERAAEIAAELARDCTEERNRQAILSHMIFYLRATDTDLATDLSLGRFPTNEVQREINRIDAMEVGI